MRRNRFEQVDEPQSDAITLTLVRREGETFGTVTCPSELTGMRLPQGASSDEMGGIEAFRSAIRLANEIKAPIVVIDAEGGWMAEWGDLYRDV